MASLLLIEREADNYVLFNPSTIEMNQMILNKVADRRRMHGFTAHWILVLLLVWHFVEVISEQRKQVISFCGNDGTIKSHD